MHGHMNVKKKDKSSVVFRRSPQYGKSELTYQPYFFFILLLLAKV
jgi:hypothetical protein